MVKTCKLSNYVFDKCHTLANISEATHCEKHGCRFCNYVNPKSSYSKSKIKIEANLKEKKEEVCSPECKKKAETEEFQKNFGEEQEEKKKIAERMEEFNDDTTAEIKNTFSPFYEEIKEVKINELRKKVLRGEINLFQFGILCITSIDVNSSLESDEREEWKKIWQKVSSWKDLLNLCLLEKNFLVSLAKKYKDLQEQRDQEKNTPECKNCKLRREQPTTFPVSCENWCQECISKKQREEQKKDNNDEYVPPFNSPFPVDNSPKNNEENFPGEPSYSPPTPTNPSSQTDSDKQREREREREQNQNLPREGKSPSLNKKNDTKLPSREEKKVDYTPIYVASGIIGTVIVATVVIIIVKKRNSKFFKKG